jgi:mono/diheme cytochrome c family protein
MRLRRTLRLMSRALLVLVLLLAVAVGLLYAWSTWRLGRHYDVPVASVVVPTHPAALERGRHLAETVALCSHCHGSDFGGTKFFDETPLVARLPAPNLTSGRGGIGRSYTDSDWVRALRHGVAPGGRALLIMPSAEFARFSADDVGAIIAYVKSRPPVDREWPPMSVGPVGRVMLFLETEQLLPVLGIDHDAALPSSPPVDVVPRGEHLVSVAGCRGCHASDFTGGKGPPPVAANITPVGLGEWNETDFVRAMRTGVAPGNRALDAAMPRAYGQMTDEELHAMWSYLRTVAAKGEKTARQRTSPNPVTAF